MSAPYHAATRARSAGRQASHSSGLRLAARAGMIARGVVYILVGSLAVGVAFGRPGASADRNGALQTIAGKPGGGIALWLIVAGFAGLALWRLAEAAYGPTGKIGNRLASLARGVLYAVLCATTAAFTLGAGGTQSSDAKSKDLTGQVMHDVPAGRWLVLAGGLVLVGVGVAIAVRALQRTFTKHLNTARMSRRERSAVETLGVIGLTARGVVYAAVGVLFCYAGISFDPAKAQGMDGTLREFTKTPVGPWLLVAVALGLVIFGLYSFCEARWRKVQPR